MCNNHTPLPWRRNDQSTPSGQRTIEIWRHEPNELPITRIATVHGQPVPIEHGDHVCNADFIVRAVNSHDDLLFLLKTVLIRLDMEAGWRAADGRSPEFPCAAMREDIRAAIAKAEA